MYYDEKENLQPESEDASNHVMSPPQVLQHSAEPVMQEPIKLNESKDE